MIIYVVQDGDTIASIANEFGVSESRLLRQNCLPNANNLVTGQTILITDPQETYIVKEGDNLSEIAKSYGIPIMQLYRNNPYLWDREYIYPGEELIISYNTKGTITTSGYAFPYIDSKILRKSLPYLTYLSILNYRTMRGGEIQSYYDDSQIIKTAKEFGVLPLMLVSGVSFRGEKEPEMIYELLLDPNYQENHAKNMLRILKEKAYYGVNVTITYLNKTNQELYINWLNMITSYLSKEGYPVFVTIDPNFITDGNELLFEEINYAYYNKVIEEIYVMRFYWGTNYGPPMPVSSIHNISLYINYMKQTIDPQKINVGFPLLGYVWELPYMRGLSKGNAISLDSAIELALLMGATILFDDVSKTPYYEYSVDVGKGHNNIVWFVDARTVNAIMDLVFENGLGGTGLWNIMNFCPQLWLIMNSNFTIEKLLPETDS